MSVTTRVIAYQFVNQYFKIVMRAPESSYRFYHEDAFLKFNKQKFEGNVAIRSGLAKLQFDIDDGWCS